MLIYPNTEDIKILHDFLIEIYKEEEFPEKIEPGYNYESAIDSVLDLALRDNLHGQPLFPHTLQKAAVFLYYLNIFHPFTDGNKRTSLLVTHYFLRWNGYKLEIPKDAANFLIKIAIPESNLSYVDAYAWILKHTKRSIFDILRGLILPILPESPNSDEGSLFFQLLDLYAFNPLPEFIWDALRKSVEREQEEPGH